VKERLRWRSNASEKKREKSEEKATRAEIFSESTKSLFSLSYPRHITALSSVHSSIAGAQRQMSHCGAEDQGEAETASCSAPAEPAA